MNRLSNGLEQRAGGSANRSIIGGRHGIAIALMISCAVHAAPAAAQGCKTTRHGWDTASTIGEIGLAVTAVGVPVLKKDWRGLKQAGFSLGASTAVSEVMKRSFKEWRPDCTDRRSFPSGHTSISFASAFTLQQRYGWRYGAPALAVATFVGVARVAAHKHHWYDVVAGAGIGSASGILLTKRLKVRGQEVAVTPWAGSKGGGVSVSFAF